MSPVQYSFPHLFVEGEAGIRKGRPAVGGVTPTAELMILDRSRFDEVVAGLMGDDQALRLNQESLFERCKAELKKPALVRKKRDAILSGDII